MAEQSHPPYVSGATTIPRQLERWLDINPQNGPLRRTETFIQVPVFNINHVWNGYSEIVGEYHYSSPNNLSLKLLNTANVIPVDTNYTLTVSYIVSPGVVKRYSLIRSANDFFYFDLPVYSGEFISSDFSIEIWNTSSVICSETTLTTLYTSVKGNLDYRYGVDTALASTQQLCSSQQNPQSTILYPIDVNMELWLDGGTGWSEHTWIDRSLSANVFTSNIDMATRTPPNAVQFGSSVYSGSAAFPQSMWLYFITGVGNGYQLMSFDNQVGETVTLAVNGSSAIQISLDPGSTFTGTYALQEGTPYILYFDGTSDCRLYDAVTLMQLDQITHDTINLIVPSVNILFGDDSGIQYEVRAFLCYNDITNTSFYTDSLFPYLQSLPSGGTVMIVPFVFDPCNTNPNPTVQQGVIAVG
jgi:hypothetical protein